VDAYDRARRRVREKATAEHAYLFRFLKDGPGGLAAGAVPPAAGSPGTERSSARGQATPSSRGRLGLTMAFRVGRHPEGCSPYLPREAAGGGPPAEAGASRLKSRGWRGQASGSEVRSAVAGAELEARPLHHALCGARSPSRHRCRDGGGSCETRGCASDRISDGGESGRSLLVAVRPSIQSKLAFEPTANLRGRLCVLRKDVEHHERSVCFLPNGLDLGRGLEEFLRQAWHINIGTVRWPARDFDLPRDMSPR